MIVSCGVLLDDQTWNSSTPILGPGNKMHKTTLIYWPNVERRVNLPTDNGRPETCCMAVARNVKGKFFATTDSMNLDYLVVDWPMSACSSS